MLLYFLQWSTKQFVGQTLAVQLSGVSTSAWASFCYTRGYWHRSHFPVTKSWFGGPVILSLHSLLGNQCYAHPLLPRLKSVGICGNRGWLGALCVPCPKHGSLSEHPTSIHLVNHGKREPLKSPVIWVASFLPATLSFVCVQKTFPRELIPQTFHKAKPTVALWNQGLYFPMIEQGSNLPAHGVAVSCESTKTAEDSFGPLNTLFLICGGTEEFAASHLLKYNSLQNTKQMHSALCGHVITLCVPVTHICSILAGSTPS